MNLFILFKDTLALIENNKKVPFLVVLFLFNSIKEGQGICYKFILNQLVNSLSGLHGIVAYSVFQMPHDDQKRRKIFKSINKIIMDITHLYY